MFLEMPLTLSKAELQGLVDELQEELASQGGGYLLRVVYGRKPAKPNPYAAPKYAPKQALQPSSEMYSMLVKNTTVDVASYALELLGPIEIGSAVHDNGCGCLEATRAFLKKPQASNFTIAATDADPFMVNRAKEISGAQNWQNVTVSHMPAEVLKFPDNYFSQSVSNILIFMTANDGIDCAKEIYRTLKPGGKAAVTTWAKMPHSEPVDDVHHTLRGKDAELMFVMPEQWWRLSHLKSVLQQGGFKAEEVEIKTCEVILKIEEHELYDHAAMIWSLRGMPKGGWKKEDEEHWDKAVEMIAEGMRNKSDTEIALKGEGVAFKMVANIAVCRKLGVLA
jgi:SAM-dependent methyltransferase